MMPHHRDRTSAGCLVVAVLAVVLGASRAMAQEPPLVPRFAASAAIPFHAASQAVVAPALVTPIKGDPVTSQPGLEIERLRQRKIWRAGLVKIARPTRGCFKTTFPDTTWHPVACKPPPHVPFRPSKRPRPESVGNGAVNDFSAQSAGGPISSAEGSFDTVSSGIKESGQNAGTGPAVTNAYSLQLNTNLFASASCAGAANPATCAGWTQFVLSNDGDSGNTFIQYWLVGYDKACPANWTPSAYAGGNDCYRNSTNATPTPNIPVSALAQVSVVGAVSTSGDSVLVLVGDDVYSADGDNILETAKGWQVAEFNVFGNCCGAEATFGPGTTLVVRTALTGGSSTKAPLCELNSFTGETNNLTLSGTPPIASATSPAVVFTETNAGATPAGCASAAGSGNSLQLVSGEQYVDFAKDQTGLSHYTVGGAMCVVHSPSCPGNAFSGIFGVGHNGKDHYFPADKPLPAGVTVEGVLYTMYWPPGIDHTDRGGLGSKGSYGADADAAIKAKAPFYSVGWQNACQPSTGADWSAQNVTYQVSFVVSVPSGVTVDGAVPMSTPTGPICRAGDIPRGNGNNEPPGTAISNYTVVLRSWAPADGGHLAFAGVFPPSGAEATATPITSWIVQSITNVNNFDVFLVAPGSDSTQCFQSGHGQLIKRNSIYTGIASLFGSANAPLNLVACTSGAVPSQVMLSVKYQY